MNDQSRRTEPKDPRVEAALREYLEGVDRGELVDREEFLSRHSEIADELRSFIVAEDEVRKLAGAETPLDRLHDSTKSLSTHGLETVVPHSVELRAAEAGGTGLSGQFGRYRIIRALGKGAMGTVYLAEDTQLERSVAIKTPHFEVSPTGEMLERFYREARAAATLRHANICPVYDVGQIGGKHYISMAYIEGRPLSTFIQPDKPQTERQILIVIRKLALALQEAHDHGIVHRDLKPANIMVDKKGEPLIMDFGLAQHIRGKDDIRLTQTGNLLGTPAYMSPEQVEGEPNKIGSPTDQYSLGVILYELLTGQLPFRGPLSVVMAQILTKQPPPPCQLRSGLDPRIQAVCLKMMAKTSSERFPSLKSVADELAVILKSPAAKTASKEKPASPSGPSQAGNQADGGASQVLESLNSKTMTESDLASLEELARKCYSRRDYDQVIQIIGRISEERRSAGLQALLEKARGKADEIDFLICEIDEADRLNDRTTALKKAENLLAIKPGHRRARAVQEKYAAYGAGGAARIGVLDRFRRPISDGGWIPWSVLAFGLAVVGVMTAVIVIYLRGTAIVVDIQDSGVAVTVNGSDVVVTGPKNEKVTVTPGDQELTITYAGLKLITKSFSLQQGEKRTVTVSIVNKEIVARLEKEILPLTAVSEEKTSSPTASGKTLLPLTPARDATSTATRSPRFENSLGMEFVLVPKGKSWLGGGGGKPGDKEVVIAQDFYLGKYEVTQEEWKQVTGVTPSGFSRTSDRKGMVKDVTDAELKRFPVERVSWDDAQLFLDRLNKHEKDAAWVYRLPKEVEWEYACRGGPLSDKSESAYDYYFDKPTNQLLPAQANFGKGLKRPCKVGSYRPNRLGLYDMHGNVWEWCDDAEQAADGAPQRIARGGSWVSRPGHCGAAHRDADPQSLRDAKVGLRVARVPVGTEVVTFPPQSLPNRAQETKPAIAEVSAPPPLVAPFDAAAARTGQQSWAAYLKTPVEIGNSIGMKFVLVPAGVFTMGSPPEELGHQSNENQVPVTLTQAFWLGQHVVTQAEWQLMMQTAPWKSRAQVKQGRDYPATNVSWNDARRFCERLTQQERTAGSLPFGWQYTLPTEAQWEYACRAGTISRYSFGDDESKLSDYAWWGGPVGGNASAEQYAHAVGQKKPNRFGLSDMHGNVWEWCRDSYANGLPGGTNPLGLSQGSDRVNRAGSWYSSAALCRSASRKGFGPSERRRDLGFRVARVPVGTEPVGTEVVKIPPGEKRPAEAALSAPAVTPMPSVATTAPKISGRPFLVRGEWTIENDELVQPTLAAGHEHPLVVFGGPALSHYDLTLEAKETGGYEALGIFFHWLGPGHYRKFFLASNRELNFSYSYDGKWSRDDGSRKKLSYSANQWYSLKLEVRGDTFRAYLDGVLRFEQIDGRFTHGRICLFTSDTAARFRRIRVSDPQGTVLFEGLPELPSASNKTAP